MQWILACHIIFFVAWFAGLFYLPRLFVYHAPTSDVISLDRFKIMEHKLYYFIMWPAAILTGLSGLILLSLNYDYYRTQNWMHIKLISVLVLCLYHLYCGHLVKCFKHNRNPHSAKFYRFFNEIPTILLIIIVMMAILRPF